MCVFSIHGQRYRAVSPHTVVTMAAASIERMKRFAVPAALPSRLSAATAQASPINAFTKYSTVQMAMIPARSSSFPSQA